MPKIILAVGGSGGHVLPAIALAKQLGNSAILVGVDLHSNPYILNTSVEYQSIQGNTISLRLSSKNIKAVSQVIKGFMQAWKILKKHTPASVIGFGSFHSFPTLLAALFLKIPIILYSPDASLGLVNRIFFPFAKVVGMYFPLSHPKVEKLKIEYTTSTLSVEQARSYFGLDPNIPTLLVFGGSQGALSINSFIIDLIGKIDFQIIHLVGSKENIDVVKQQYKKHHFKSCVKAFEENMNIAYLAADIAITRAGASTIKELISVNLPAIVIPYPYAKQHQIENGKFFTKIVQGGFCTLQQEFPGSSLKQIAELYAQRDNLKENIKKFHQNDKGFYLHQIVNNVLGTK
ncbi:MAG: UDP-N-acetylglucosamine--N-acetylmuramyl-(pentapeptide) pyrophosphoryl-undecaprenol N-acetylglucosamine transferase [Chlamydiales bacterium]|nr:UDP-N-acetylglucosamine--N-acetylmuramyl-(pentapeptide) pyrophosphoryl-undecaprenol N-acetylglucosamine transferase [Chlamydiales bacterium]